MSEEQILPALPVFPAPEAHTRGGPVLQIGGLCRSPVTLSLAEIFALPAVEVTADFRCEEGWAVPEQRWRGVRLRELLAAVEPLAAARFVAADAGDFVTVVPLEQAAEHDLVLAYELNGAPLPPEHGGPLRLIASWTACYQSVKWVERIELTAKDGMETARPIALARIEAASSKEETAC